MMDQLDQLASANYSNFYYPSRAVFDMYLTCRLDMHFLWCRLAIHNQPYTFVTVDLVFICLKLICNYTYIIHIIIMLFTEPLLVLVALMSMHKWWKNFKLKIGVIIFTCDPINISLTFLFFL